MRSSFMGRAVLFRCTGAALRRLRLPAAGILVLSSMACDQSTAPQQKTSGQLHFLELPAGAPTVAEDTLRFYAKVGRADVATIWNRAKAGAPDSTKFLEFSVREASLDRGPDGRRLTAGDSILIMIVPDRTQLAVKFSPSGLTFSKQTPAKLTLYFMELGGDLNRDGIVDQADTDARTKLSIWRQEADGQAWFKVASTLTASARMDASVEGFSGFALAF